MNKTTEDLENTFNLEGIYISVDVRDEDIAVVSLLFDNESLDNLEFEISRQYLKQIGDLINETLTDWNTTSSNE